jgi:cold-inducible RNA-binding protein
MGTKLYVGNLPFDITEEDLRNMLSQHGPVNDIAVVMDKITGRARGFAFATMNTEEGAKATILALNGKDWKGRALTVNEARPREERSGGGGYGGGARSRY